MHRRPARPALKFALLFSGALLTAGCGPEESLPAARTEASVATAAHPLYVDTTALWGAPRISVCWENPGSTDGTQRAWVQAAAEGSWEAVSAVDFVGWGPCAPLSQGIRIRISDEGPHVKQLGSRLNGYASGMVLNFTFQRWETSCQSTLEYCIRAIAVHEFGHALGFAHEQNRPDTPSWCDEEQGSYGNVTIGAWDLASVMNYCNPNWNGDGQLSATDVAGVVQLYGELPWSREFVYESNWYVDKHPRTVADVNGDGRGDVVGFGDTGVQVALSTGGRFNSAQLWLRHFGFEAGNWYVDRHPRTAADVNGDGRADIVGFGDTGVQVSLSTGTGLGAPQLWLQAFGANAGSWSVARHVRTLGDVNGDGRADVVGFGDTGVQVSLSTGTGFTVPQLWLRNFGYNAGNWYVDKHPRTVADVNGDGRDDIIGFGDTGAQVSLSTGTGFTAPQLWVQAFGYGAGSWSVTRHVRTVADVNGDGRADAIGFGDTGVQVGLSSGASFAAPQLWLHDFGYSAGNWYVDKHPRTVADVNGDGRADAIGFGDYGVRVHLF